MIRSRIETVLRGLWFDGARRPGLRLLGAALAPLCALTRRVAAKNRAAIRALADPPVPVLVVGNLVAGGAGKTPLVAAIAGELARRGWNPGILTGAYGTRRQNARIVSPADEPSVAGDEALWLARTTGLPVAAGRLRGQALERLLRSNPSIDLVISDDGLQHPTLPRTIELVVFDLRGTGNGRLLPAGPLREPIERLAEVDAILVNGDPQALAGPWADAARPVFGFRIVPTRFSRVGERDDVLALDAFVSHAAGRPIAAIAGMGDPDRFFRTLAGLGLQLGHKLLPGDHQALTVAAMAGIAEPLVVMTTKDAVKYDGLADDRCWALEVEAIPDPGFADWLDNELRKARNGHPPARHPGLPDLQGPAAA